MAKERHVRKVVERVGDLDCHAMDMAVNFQQ